MSGERAAAAPVRTAVVGLGWAAKTIWLPRLRAHPDFAITAVVDPLPPEDAELDSLDVSRYEEAALLDPAAVDLAIVAVPNRLHAEVGCRLLAKGISVFLEKPVCVSSDEAELLAAAERAGGARLLAGSAARYRSDVRALAELIPSLGRIRHVDLSWVRARGVPDVGGWFTCRRHSGGGALIDLGWHLLDLVPTLLGPTTFGQVVGTIADDYVNDPSSGTAWRDCAREVAAEEVADVENTARGFLVADSGVSVSVRASWRSHEPLDTTTITIEGGAGTATLACTFGFSPNRSGGPVLTVTRDGESVAVPVRKEAIGAEYGTQLDELAGELADPAARGRAVREARVTIGVIERLYESARLDPELPGGAVRDVRAIVFDLDGVLIDSTDVMRRAFQTAYAEVVGEGEAPFAEYNKHLGRYFPDIMRIMGLPPEMEEPFVRESYRLAGQVSMFDGVPELLAELRDRGVVMAVATGKSGPRARSLLELLGVLPLLDHVIGSDEVSHPKPAPDIVELALQKLGVRAEDAIMVGDAVTDLESAHAAGVRAVAALWGESDAAALLAADPDLTLSDPLEVLRLCQPVAVQA